MEIHEFIGTWENESGNILEIRCNERAKFMDECYRILKPDAKMRLVHPYYKSVRAVQDFSHKWPPISENSYLYWRKDFREGNKLTHGVYNLKCNFDFNIFYTWQDAT